MQEKRIFPCYNASVGASILSAMAGKWYTVCSLAAADADHTHENRL